MGIIDFTILQYHIAYRQPIRRALHGCGYYYRARATPEAGNFS